MHIGQVLGIETYKDTANLVQGIMRQTWKESFTTKDVWVLSFALITVLLLVLVQTFRITTSKKREISWAKVLMGLIFDLMVFVFLIIAQLKVINWLIEVRAPRQLRVERISPELVSVSWKTYDPEASLIYWGYMPDRLQNAEVGISGGELSRDHEVLLPTEVGREVYLRVVVGREQYGVNVKRGGEPYGVSGGSQ